MESTDGDQPSGEAPSAGYVEPTGDRDELGGARVAVPDAAWEPDAPLGPSGVSGAAGVEPTLAPEAMVDTTSSAHVAFEPGIQRGDDDDVVFDDHVPHASDLICPDATCHTRNPAGLVFCRRCGTELSTGEGLADEAKVSWWSRLKAKLTGRDLRSTAAQAKYQTRRVKGLSTRAKMFRTALLGGAVGAVLLGSSPGIRARVTDSVKDMTFADRYRFVNVESVTSSAPIEAGWEPELILDGSYNRAWGVAWVPGTAGFEVVLEGAGCVDGPYPVLRFELSDDEEIDRLRVWGGTWERDEARELRPRPKMLQIRPIGTDADDDCVYVELEDSPEPQAHGVDLPRVDALEVSVVAVYPGEDDERLLAISELWFERQR